MNTNAVRTIDLPGGGFLVLEHVLRVDISRPSEVIQSYQNFGYTVNVTTTHGASVSAAWFPIDQFSDECHLNQGGEGCLLTYEVPSVRAKAEAFATELWLAITAARPAPCCSMHG